MVFNATFNNISAISSGGQVYCQRKPVYPNKTTDLPQVTDKLYHTNKCQRIPKGQSKMENTEKLATQTKKKKTKTQHNMCCTPLYSNKHNTTCVVHHYTLTNTNNVNKKRVLLQTTGGKDKPNIDFIRKSKRTSKQGTPNVKTHNKAFLDFYHQLHISQNINDMKFQL